MLNISNSSNFFFTVIFNSELHVLGHRCSHHISVSKSCPGFFWQKKWRIKQLGSTNNFCRRAYKARLFISPGNLWRLNPYLLINRRLFSYKLSQLSKVHEGKQIDSCRLWQCFKLPWNLNICHFLGWLKETFSSNFEHWQKWDGKWCTPNDNITELAK